MKSSSHKCGPCGLKTGWGPALLATAHRGAVHVNVIEGELAQHKICGFHLHLKEGFAALLKLHEKQIEALEKGFGVGLALLHFEWWQEVYSKFYKFLSFRPPLVRPGKQKQEPSRGNA